MGHNDVDIILPPVWTGVYFNTARLLKYSIEDLGLKASICVVGEMRGGELSIILGWHLIPDKINFEKPYIIYQLEPLVLPLWKGKIKQKIKLFKNAKVIWDYSVANKESLNQLGFQPEIVPLGYHPKLDEIAPSAYPDYDVLFVGYMSERRKKIISELQQYCCISIQPRWGKDFLDALGRSKMLLNIHQYDVPTPLEQPRISYALNNDVFVISEKCIDSPYEGLVTCNVNNIKDVVLDYLHNPMKRNERNIKALNGFKVFKMKNTITKLSSINIQNQPNAKNSLQ